MQKGTVIPGRNDHTLLPYHLVLPCTPGSPQIPVLGWISCIQGYRANLITACLYLYNMSWSSIRKGANLSHFNDQFHR